MRCVLIGLPGSGKGTQAAYLADRFGVPHISTGDMMRAAMDSGSDLGLRARKAVESGELVSDDIVIGLVANRIREPDGRKGFVIDGFPRTVAQADALMMARVDLDYVIELQVPEREIMQRMSGRRVHPASGRVYHVKYNPPRVPGRDDATGEPLVQRSDDCEEVVKVRIGTYYSHTVPIVSYYLDWQRSGDPRAPRFVRLNGQSAPVRVREHLLAQLAEPATAA